MKRIQFLFMFVLLTGSIFSEEANPESMLRKFLEPGADLRLLTQALQPTEEDYILYFGKENSKKAQNGYSGLWNSKTEIGPRPGQTDLFLYSARVSDLQKGDSLGEFPGGYRKIVSLLNPELRIYGFKFVKPGQRSGMAYDGLVFLRGRWVLFPKPWRVFR
ncbi:MAG: hypothetical protein H7A24_17695 [Leptospiraceae bacterium]|nr:hypothetical protein [Leptospiraceae bacterium]MCP5513728.1 hypothetical protein [Leptospiraceae bacterium]